MKKYLIQLVDLYWLIPFYLSKMYTIISNDTPHLKNIKHFKKFECKSYFSGTFVSTGNKLNQKNNLWIFNFY